MKLKLAAACLWVAMLGCLAPMSARATDVDTLLAHAEQVRSSDPKEFAAALAQLEQLRTEATPPQRLQLRLLKDYQSVIKGEYDAAIKDALGVYEEASAPEIKYRAGLIVANTAAITRDFSLGLRYLENALTLQDKVGDTDLRHTGYAVAAILYNQYGQFVLGQHYAQLLLSQKASPRNQCLAKVLRVEATFGLDIAMDQSEIDSAIEDCAGQREPIAANLLRGFAARKLAAQGKTAAAIELLQAHLAEVEATRYPRLIGEIHGLLAEYQLEQGNVAEAEAQAFAALAKGGKDNYSLPLVTAHKVLYQAAMRRHDLSSALEQYRSYAEADKARMDEVKAREFAFQLSRHELQQKIQAIELLSRQNEVLRLQQEVAAKSAINTRLLIAMLLMALGIGAYWAYKIKRVQMMFRKQAQVDSLTGVSNRRHFRDQAEAQLARCRTANREAALVLLDLDNFKHINDRHGHAMGDWVLTQVASACRAACREGDLFGRLGGEEFAILTCGGDLQAAERIAQQCRDNLAAIDTSSLDQAPAITASFGCATTKLAGHGFETLFTHADRAMYRAKAEGRDRICVHEEGRPVAVRLQAQA